MKCHYCDREANVEGGVDGKCWFHSEDDTVSASELWAEYLKNGQGSPDEEDSDDV